MGSGHVKSDLSNQNFAQDCFSLHAKKDLHLRYKFLPTFTIAFQIQIIIFRIKLVKAINFAFEMQIFALETHIF